MATLEERARYIAEQANECCNRSDGYEENIYKIALTLLQEVAGEAEQLRGTMRYIAAQAKAGHAGALRVIQSNAEAALDGTTSKVRGMLRAVDEQSTRERENATGNGRGHVH